MAINPISWTRTDTPAPAGDNLGSWMHVDDGYKKVMGLADATVKTIGDDYEVVVCSTADVTVYGVPCEMSPALGMGSFHTNDIQFYYYNLRENAERRLQTYFQNH